MFRRRSRPQAQDVRSDAEWRASLDPEAYRVLRRAGTEAPRTSPYEHPPADPTGAYRCAGCEAELFRADDQFDSRTGWPSFTSAATPDAVHVRNDFSMLLPRREVACTRCGGHLGHVFADGPAPTGQRWCINGAALTLDDSARDDLAEPPD